MARVVPSQVVEVINQLYPFTATQTEGQKLSLTSTDSPQVAGIADLIERIPGELIVLNPQAYAHFVVCVGALRESTELWRTRGATHELRHLQGLPDLHPLTIIRRALAQCPDEAPSPQTAELAFVTDADLRNDLRTDLSGAHRAYANGEWKAATVLGGTVIEALSLWFVQEAERATPGVIQKTAKSVWTKTLAHLPTGDPVTWTLHELVEVAHALSGGKIKTETVAQCRLSKDFRNLIHPGRAIRKGMACNRATALSALAGAEHVIADLS